VFPAVGAAFVKNVYAFLYPMKISVRLYLRHPGASVCLSVCTGITQRSDKTLFMYWNVEQLGDMVQLKLEPIMWLIKQYTEGTAGRGRLSDLDSRALCMLLYVVQYAVTSWCEIALSSVYVVIIPCLSLILFHICHNGMCQPKFFARSRTVLMLGVCWCRGGV